MRKNFSVGALVLAIVAVILLIVTLFPFFWMVSLSLRPHKEAMAFPPRLLPVTFETSHYLRILKDASFVRYFLNSLFVSIVITVVSVASSMMMGYAFAKFSFPLKNVLFYAILATIMIPFEAYMVPLYITTMKLRLLNSYGGIILPSIISSFGTFFMKQNMEAIPDSLLESAKMDGAGNFRAFRVIAVPLSQSAMAVLSILLFQVAWSEFLWPLLITQTKKLYVLEIGLSLLQNEYFVDYGLMMAGSAVALIPMLVIFILFRQYIIEGIALQGIKA
jgi:multiple sugar transport system permease protein